MNDKLLFFMNSFMFELESKLNNNLKYFDDVQFQFDEANTDQQIKIKIKQFILEYFNKIETVTEIRDEKGKYFSSTDDFVIKYVKVPSELSDEDKTFVRDSRQAVYTNPDLLLIISDGFNEYKVAVEVKSTKNDKIPGSSIQQIDINDWVIFLKHDDNKIIEFVTGKYLNSISGTMQFPDRSPRPQVSYKILKDWNKEHRRFEDGILMYDLDASYNDKVQLLDDWQMLLANRWLDILKNKRKTNAEPWFNNNIRKFSILLLKYYDCLSQEEKEKFKNIIKDNIEGDDNE